MLQSSSLQALVTLALAWAAWRMLKRLLIPHPLDRIPGLKASSWISGSLLQVFDQDGWSFHDDVADKYGGVFRFQGFFGARYIYVHDPTALLHIASKDQHLYESADDMILMNALVIGQGLLSTRGNQHNRQRKVLLPMFSPSQMRDITPVFHDVAQDLCDAIARQISQGKNQINMLEWFSRTALEFVARGALGTSFDVYKEEIEHPYSVSLRNFARIMTFPGFIFPRFFILPYVKDWGTPGFRRWVVDMLPWKSLHILRDMVDVMHNTSVAIFESRKDAILNEEELSMEPGKGKDVMSVLLTANLAAPEQDRLLDSELIAQISTMTFAGMEPTSNALARILCLLCEHPEAQEKLRQEVRDARKIGGSIPYDDLMSLPYLDAVCKETLRVYTPIPLIAKQAQEDVILPLSKPITSLDGKPVTEIQLPRKTYIYISLNACNRDPAIWGEDSREWKPERWLSPLPETVAGARIPGVYSNLMSFYGGQRSCIGLKFAELEMKIVLSSLLQKFRFALSDTKIIWKMNGVNQPMAGDSDADLDKYGLPRLQLPLRVTLLSDSD